MPQHTFQIRSNCEQYRAWRHDLSKGMWVLDCLQVDGIDLVHCQQNSRELGALQLVHTAITPVHLHRSADALAADQRDMYSVSVMLQGRALHRFQNHEQPLLPGDLLLTDIKRSYEIRCLAKCEFISFVMPRDLVRSCLPCAEAVSGHRLTGEGGLHRVVGPMMTNIYRNQPGLSSPERSIIGHHLQEMVSATYLSAFSEFAKRANRSHQHLLAEITLYINSNLSDAGLTPVSLAARFRISERLLYKLFEATGETPSSYIWSKRFERSRELLCLPAHRQKSISEIAFSNGFNCAAHFSREFRRRFGSSPSEYRTEMMSAHHVQA